MPDCVVAVWAQVSAYIKGDPAPGGGIYQLAFGGVLNKQGEVLFIGDLSKTPHAGQEPGVFLWSHGSTIAVARPGDAMPGGGHMRSASFFVQGYSINDRGEVYFFATLDTDKDGDGKDDCGVFRWKNGDLSPVLRTGTVIPGIGTVSLVADGWGYGGAVSNNKGELLLSMTTTAGNTYLLKGTPK